MIQDATSGLGGDALQVAAWLSAALGAIFALRFLYACWKGKDYERWMDGDIRKSRGFLAALTLLCAAFAHVTSGEAARLYAESNGFDTGAVYWSFFTMMPGGLVLVAPFVLMVSGRRASNARPARPGAQET
ncbi:hypothetical protein ACV344_29835 [Pseudomonas aeruginosa]|uniref:hypothetical protein n=1 Tax=Pseudomonas aeruginosa TaxID=287 RepID=UPI000E6873D6|nr:hypothetical protein [Pseudomonas aeruginosa]MBA5106210.1 hypothetical protein [Pseudomonas aeruginosa]MBD1300236.1 hypothetical protein [Pseudomonas aeruginosa]MBD1340781.1 hypothetical protein [Pseudomonas aeruginosa]MBG4604184.1 hypothetical protein [Pseudomonas aeruginosa]MBH3592977.1 hypothetical protein [Pseudomonas aeruginosa]